VQGTTIKDFTLVSRLGQGTTGEVWLAEQQATKRRVAIKILGEDVSRDSPVVQRFFNEATAVGRIQHGGTVSIYDAGFVGARAFLIMELLEGETLTSYIDKPGRIPLPQIADMGQQIASVLEASHAAGITHRDLKPDNIFVLPDPQRPKHRRIKILDFGIAKIRGVDGNTASSASMGTPAYMPPELWKDAATADPRSDIYAFGCVVFEMCTERAPFPASSVGEACMQHMTAAPPRISSLLPAVSGEIDELVVRMMAKSPGDRPALTEILAAFARFVTFATLRESPQASAPAPIPTAAAPAPSRRGLVIAIVAALAVAIAGVTLAVAL
jgi:eukaryotic-like serine/threonine-protein kinase